jgi:4,5-dihydroxyphthalate decarboxylase
VRNIPLTVACGHYDHMEALSRGIVQPTGIDVTYLAHESPPEIFARMIKTNAFDISEMSLAMYFTLKSKGDFPYIALPVFPCRVFRHAYIYVNRDAGITEPKDLEGKKIGVQQYRQTAATWVRGILQNEYDVDMSGMTFVEGGVNVSRPPDEDLDIMPDTKISISSAPSGKSINDLLINGDVAAYFGARQPDCYKSHDNIVRLFPDYRKEERKFFDRTGIFPIMHCLVMSEEMHRQNPWIAENMVKAFEESKQWALDRMRFTGTIRYMVPWLNHEIEEVDDMFTKGDPYPMGVEANRVTLEMLMKYLVDQSFVADPVPKVDDMFTRIVGWAE